MPLSAGRHIRTTLKQILDALPRSAVRAMLLVFLCAAPVKAQNVLDRSLQTLAGNAARSVENAIALRVQQVISSLPPSSPQALAYKFDPDLNTFVRSESIPPAAFLTPDTVPRGSIGLRASVSYFDLRPLEKKANFLFSIDDQNAPVGGSSRTSLGVFKFGVAAQARAEVVTLAGSYGLTPYIELDVNIPVTIVAATASFQYSATRGGDPTLAQFLGTSSFGNLTLFPSAKRLDDELARGGSAFLVTRPVSDVGISGLDGTSKVGLARTSLDAKIALVTRPDVKLSAYTGVFLPSPSAKELAGTATTSLFPRLIGSASVGPSLDVFSDVGYEYDFEEDTLRRFAWSVGTSFSAAPLSVDLGVSGSLYDKGITLFNGESSLSSVVFRRVSITSLDQFQLQTNLVDVVVGLTFPITETALISGTATIPVVNVDFRPEAIGSISAQILF